VRRLNDVYWYKSMVYLYERVVGERWCDGGNGGNSGDGCS